MPKTKKHTALVSVSDGGVEGYHHTCVKCYNLREPAGDIWIAIILVPDRGGLLVRFL